MILETKRLVLRPWNTDDAESLFEYAKDPAVGPIAGWPPHKSVAESRSVIETILNGAECYAVCLKDGKAIGAVELILFERTDLAKNESECELGYWIGKPFWGNGCIPEASRELLRRGFEDLNMTSVWCAYYDGNAKSKRVQEKCGFVYHHTNFGESVPLLGETRTAHVNLLTKEKWLSGR